MGFAEGLGEVAVLATRPIMADLAGRVASVAVIAGALFAGRPLAQVLWDVFAAHPFPG
jgi:hypothetical protein